MDLVVVAVDLFTQDTAHFFQGSGIFEDTGADNAILGLAIGTLDLSFSLRAEGIGDVHFGSLTEMRLVQI